VLENKEPQFQSISKIKMSESKLVDII